MVLNNFEMVLDNLDPMTVMRKLTTCSEQGNRANELREELGMEPILSAVI